MKHYMHQVFPLDRPFFGNVDMFRHHLPIVALLYNWRKISER